MGSILLSSSPKSSWKLKIDLPRTKINRNHSAIEQPRLVVGTSAPTHVPTYRKMIFQKVFFPNEKSHNQNHHNYNNGQDNYKYGNDDPDQIEPTWLLKIRLLLNLDHFPIIFSVITLLIVSFDLIFFDSCWGRCRILFFLNSFFICHLWQNLWFLILCF